MNKLSLQQYQKLYPNDDVCLQKIFTLRYGELKVCHSCSKETKYHRVKGRKCFECTHCGYQIYPLAGTPFEKTRTSLTKWFHAAYLFSVSKNGIAAKELERQLGITYKCAWRMGHKLRSLMINADVNPLLSGEVQVDETYVGGKRRGSGRGRSIGHKTPVFGMIETKGRVIAMPVPDVSRRTLFPLIRTNVAIGSTITSDEFRTYWGLGYDGFTHHYVEHGRRQYANQYGKNTNAIEGFWSILKRSIRGTHVWVSGKYLSNYVNECQFRYNHRKSEIPVVDIIFSRLSLMTG